MNEEQKNQQNQITPEGVPVEAPVVDEPSVNDLLDEERLEKLGGLAPQTPSVDSLPVAEATEAPAEVVATTDQTPPAEVPVETPAPPPEEEKKTEAPKEEFRNMNFGGGINLVPGLSEEEEVLLEKKEKFNFSGMSFMVGLAAITLAVLAFSGYYRIRVNSERKQTEALKAEVLAGSHLANNNNQVLDRIYLLKDIESNTYSPKEVFDYWLEVTDEFGEITNFEINNELEFRMDGTSTTLEDATKLWHLLSIDDRVSEVTLRNVSKDINSNEVFVSFEGELNPAIFMEEN